MKNIFKYLILITLSVLLYFISRSNYLLFHNIVEMYSIIIAAGIFIVSWNSRSHSDNNNLVFLGISYIFIGIIDFFHVLSYNGMNIFTDYSFYANQLWICARIIESISLLIFVLLGFRKIKIPYTLVFVIYSIVTSFFFLSVFVWKTFPVCFIAGQGQTPFKIISEYVICFILLITLILIIKNRKLYDKKLFIQIAGSIVFTILSEFCFTLYTDNFGITNVIGHLFKVISFYLIYQSVIVNTLSRPFDILYGELNVSKEKYQSLSNQLEAILDHIPGLIFYKDRKNNFIRVNKYLAQLLNKNKTELEGKNLVDLYPKEDAEKYYKDDLLVIDSGVAKLNIEELMESAEGLKWVNTSKIPFIDSNEEIIGVIGISMDITDRKQAEVKIQNLLEEKEVILKEVHHRIKNNMNVIYSLITLQADSQVNVEIKNILLDSASRVQSMMILYDKLYRSDISGELSIKDYLPSLIYEISSIFSKKETVKIETQIEPIVLHAKILSSLGIIINELITNSMKYAFSGRNEGIIKVTASKNENRVSIIYEDNGTGIPESVSFENLTGFGMQLVNMLVKQIKGTIVIQRENGTRFIIEFDV